MISFRPESDATRGNTAEQNIRGFRPMSAAMSACRNSKLCPELSRAGPIEMPCAATVTVGDAHLWLSRLYQIFVETSVLWLPRSVPPLKTGRSQWRPALRQAASSLARLDPDGKWNGLPNVA